VQGGAPRSLGKLASRCGVVVSTRVKRSKKSRSARGRSHSAASIAAERSVSTSSGGCKELIKTSQQLSVNDEDTDRKTRVDEEVTLRGSSRSVR